MNSWDTPDGADEAGNAILVLNTLYLLIDKGLITKEDAAAVCIKTATKVREGSEDGAAPQFGEQAARRFETMAAWCLGIRPRL